MRVLKMTLCSFALALGGSRNDLGLRFQHDPALELSSARFTWTSLREARAKTHSLIQKDFVKLSAALLPIAHALQRLMRLPVSFQGVRAENTSSTSISFPNPLWGFAPGGKTALSIAFPTGNARIQRPDTIVQRPLTFPVAHVEGSPRFSALKKVIFGSRGECLRAADAALSYLHETSNGSSPSHFAATTGFVYSLEINSEAAKPGSARERER